MLKIKKRLPSFFLPEHYWQAYRWNNKRKVGKLWVLCYRGRKVNYGLVHKIRKAWEAAYYRQLNPTRREFANKKFQNKEQAMEAVEKQILLNIL